MKSFQAIALSVSFFLARSALAAPVDNPVLEQNARDAQTLNSQFSNLQASDACTPGTVACIGDQIVFCSTSKQFIADQTCPRSQSCFALPSVTGSGTTVSCTSEKTALSIFAACGADGTNLAEQAAADQRNNGTDSNGDDNNSTTTGDATVTIAQVVTVSVQSDGSPTTLGAVTQTISPDDATSLVGSLTTSTSTRTSTDSSVTSTSTSSSTSTSTSTDSTSTSSSTSTSTSSTSDSVSTLTVTSTSSSSSSTATDSSSSSSTSTTDSAAAAATTTAAAVAGATDGAIASISTTSVSRVQ